MSRHHLVLTRMAPATVMGLILLAGMSACESTRSGPGGAPVEVKVSVVDGAPVVDPEDASAHEGDDVHWIFQGRDAKEFEIIFTSVADSPFEWRKQAGASVWGTVKAGAAKGGKKTDYKYSVDVGGKVRDPRIIIEPKS
jgi:hypothetical protein